MCVVLRLAREAQFQAAELNFAARGLRRAADAGLRSFRSWEELRLRVGELHSPVGT